MGRPRSVIDWKKVDNYLTAHCKGTEIASILGISEDTLYRACQKKFKIGFALYSQQKKAGGNALLRAKQFQVAMDGDKTMLVWLGKQHLDQSDKSQITGKDGKDLNLVPTVIILPSNNRDDSSLNEPEKE